MWASCTAWLFICMVAAIDLPMGQIPIEKGLAFGREQNAVVHTVHSPVKITFTALQHAVFEKRERDVQALLQRGADPNFPNNLGCTPLYIAAHTGSLAIISSLVDHHASVSKACDDGTTPVYNAAKVGNVDVVKYLHKLGADVSQATNKDSVSPLHGAAQNGHLTTVKTLVELGACAHLNTVCMLEMKLLACSCVRDAVLQSFDLLLTSLTLSCWFLNDRHSIQVQVLTPLQTMVLHLCSLLHNSAALQLSSFWQGKVQMCFNVVMMVPLQSW